MIKGIGVDIVSIERFKKIIDSYSSKNRSASNILNRIFSLDELKALHLDSDDCGGFTERQKQRVAERAAGFFAAKESFLKAMGMGLFSYPLKKINISNKKDGKPFIMIKEDLMAEIKNLNLSISHEKGVACAFVVIEI